MSDALAPAWRRRGAWDAIIAEDYYGERSGDPGVIVEPIADAGMASLIAAHGKFEEAASVFRARHAIELPSRPAVTRGAKFDLVWSGPEQWLAVARDNRALAADLQASVPDILAVSDQTGARAVLRLSGPRFRSALAKGCPIDVDARVFVEGAAAATVISLIGVNMWRLPGEDAVHIALFRSMASSFWSWLVDSSSEFGLKIVGKP